VFEGSKVAGGISKRAFKGRTRLIAAAGAIGLAVIVAVFAFRWTNSPTPQTVEQPAQNATPAPSRSIPAPESSISKGAPEPESTIDMAKILQPGTLPELTMGDPSGVPVIEYGSLTCPHCAVFSKETFPQLKADYIDTGKVRFIFREFSRNTLDVAGFVLARCLGDDKAFAADELLFAQQDKWAFTDKPLEPLIAALRSTGLSQEKATECLKNQKLADGIVAIAKRANDEIHLTGTPTFVIDGKVYGGELTLDQLKAILDPLVKK
jgi:protein-disulfide isomerase